MAKIKKTQVIAQTVKDVEKGGTLLCYWWDFKLVQLLWPFLRKIELVLHEDPAILLLRIYPKDAPPYHKDMCSTMFIEALFIISTNWKQSRQLALN